MKKKIGLISMMLVLALGAMGLGYASWTDTLYISGTVATSDVCVKFIPPAFSLDPPDLGDPPTNYDWTCYSTNMSGRHVYGTWPGEGDSKDVGSTSANIIAPDTVEVTLDNVYPCYFTTITLHEVNCGTVPIRLRRAKLTYIHPTQGEKTVSLPEGVITYIPGWDQYGGWSNVIQILMVDTTGRQLGEPPDEAEDSFHIHVLQPAKQNWTYNFLITREAVQWNEYPGWLWVQWALDMLPGRTLCTSRAP
jgi:hypothetical protein